MVRYGRVVDKSTEFEVMVVLESSGGSVSAYGLLAEQFRRLRVEPGITLTISCDQTALSGGYLLASLASSGQLLAAPFASIGSIGVVTTELLNFHDALEKLGIKPIRFQGGQWKAPLTPFGVISEDEVAHMQQHIDSFHDAFREHVRQWRGDSIADYETIASGAYWLGKKAQELGLVDRLITSDEYIDEKLRKGDRVMKLASYKEEEKRGLLGRFLDFVTPSGSSEESSRASEFVKHESESYIVKGLKALQIGVTAMIDFAEK
jgi:serine protease SohB